MLRLARDERFVPVPARQPAAAQVSGSINEQAPVMESRIEFAAGGSLEVRYTTERTVPGTNRSFFKNRAILAGRL